MPDAAPPAGTNWITAATFLAYIVGVFVLAGLSHRLLTKKKFMGEYYLGSRGLGSWALAFTFAATSASGGSFTGFPSLIYSYGWILALWIASYMVVPICTMGVMGKRLNHVARKSGAITIPDVLRDRFESTGLALFATCTIIFFTICNLVAQFRAGAVILERTFNLDQVLAGACEWLGLGAVPEGLTGYIVGLILFAGVVVVYTTYGGFRAVVWTDVMQGVVMGTGVVILVPVVLSEIGGLQGAGERLREHPPHVVTNLPGEHNDLAFHLAGRPGTDVWIEYVVPERQQRRATVSVRRIADGDPLISVALATDGSGAVTTSAAEVEQALRASSEAMAWIEEIEAAPRRSDGSGIVAPGDEGHRRWRFIRGDEFLFGPGARPTGEAFHPLGMAISFFFMWAISGMGQPGTMVRLMAFRESRTLKRAILTVTVYYALIYMPLIFVFVAARTLIPHVPQDGSTDEIMARVSTDFVAALGPAHAVLAAVFLAAPFAAIMSTVDSFLLIISSAFVRDIYQRTINPRVSDRTVKWISYTTTAVVGVVVTLLAMQQINFLQYIIVFTGGGFASTFLAPVFLGIYWKGMTRYGAIASMVGGFLTVVGMFAPTFLGILGGQRINLLGFHPIFWGLAVSFTLAIVVSKLTGPAPRHLVDRYFHRASG